MEGMTTDGYASSTRAERAFQSVERRGLRHSNAVSSCWRVRSDAKGGLGITFARRVGERLFHRLMYSFDRSTFWPVLWTAVTVHSGRPGELQTRKAIRDREGGRSGRNATQQSCGSTRIPSLMTSQV